MKTNLLRFFGVLLSVFAVSLTASAYDFVVAGIYYNITNKTNNEVCVTSSAGASYSGSVTIPAVVNYGGVSYMVTSIGKSAFKESSFLTSINIPYSVTTIGEFAFYKCKGLTSVTIPNSVTTIRDDAFYGCSELTSITIPNSVTTIGNFAFEYCSKLTSITIPSSVTYIGNFAFYYCSGLKKVEISDLASWCKINFGNQCANPLSEAGHLYLNGVEITEMVIPNNVTNIGNYAFYGCSGLTSIKIPNSVTTIGNHAFYGCSGLKKVEISDLASWCKINFGNEYANPLWNAHHLYLNGVEIKDLIIPDGVTTIGNYAFSGCNDLISVKIPNSVTTKGESAFLQCNGLTKVEISDLASWCKINFSGTTSNPLWYAEHLYLNGVEIKDLVIPDGITSINDYAFSGCSGWTSVTIPNSVTSIGYGAFYYCSNLTSVEIPNSVTSIGVRCFYSCSGLTSITVPNSVTTIGNYAFYHCSGLTNLSIGNHIQTIGSYAFADCNKLNTVNIYATEAPTMSSDTFPYNTATFHVPRGCKAKYAFLYTFGNIIDDLENAEDSVKDIFGDEKDVRVDIYNLQGQIVKLGADKADVKDLAPGLYIINGKKVMIR